MPLSCRETQGCSNPGLKDGRPLAFNSNEWKGREGIYERKACEEIQERKVCDDIDKRRKCVGTDMHESRDCISWGAPNTHFMRRHKEARTS